MSKPDPPQPPRSRNQPTVFLAGATLLTLSSLLTRRSLLLRQKAVFPPFYHPSNAHPLVKVNGRHEAYQALGIATVNVASVFIMMGGGLLWAFDIRSVEEFKGRVRARRGVDGKWSQLGKRDEDEEEEFEKWVASLTGRKKGVGKEERRWSAREPDQEQAREENYAVIESQATNGLEKPG